MMKITAAGVWVHDQDEALAFYTEKLGFEVRSDVKVAELGNFRWITVGPPGQPDVAISLLAIPGPPMFDAETVAMIEKLMAAGVSGGIFLETEDLDAKYEELKAKGVEFVQEPTQAPYGYDAGIRDLSGNQLRLMQTPDPAAA